jgi:hypothetical protein
MSVDKSQYLSETAIRVMDETNLIRPYNPDYEEGGCASVIACDEFDKYLQHPERYSYFFANTRHNNVTEKWTNPEYQTCQLYEGKFSTEFYDYCLENHIATPFLNGIKISKDLAFVYMSFLSDVISKNQECEMFTDINKYDTLLLLNDQRLSYSQNLKYKIARSEIEFSIPENIDNIPLSEIIRLRNNRLFDDCRRAYVKEIEQFMLKREESPNISFDKQLTIGKDIKQILSCTFGVVASVYLTYSSVSSLINGNVSPSLALATAYTDFSALKDIYNAPQYIDELKIKLQARRYLGKIKKVVKSSR